MQKSIKNLYILIAWVLFVLMYAKKRGVGYWQSYKAGFDGIAGFIDEEAAKLRPSADVNWSIWKINKGSNRDEDLAWEDAVARLRENYLKRLQWMDNTINAW